MAVWESVSHFAISTSALISSIERRPTREGSLAGESIPAKRVAKHATCQKIGLSLGLPTKALWRPPSGIASVPCWKVTTPIHPKQRTLAFHYDEELVDDHHH